MASSKPVVAKTTLKKELSTNNYVAAVIAVTLIVVIICGLVAKSMLGSLIINTKLIAGKAQAKSALDTKLSNIPTLLSNYQNLGNAKQLIADGLPNNPDFPQIVSILQSISAASGVTLKDATPSTGITATTAPAAATTAPPVAGTPVSATSPTPYTFAATIGGPYNQVVSFFKNLELSDRPLHVTSAQFTGDGSSVSVQLTIQTYYQPQADVGDKTEPVK